MRTLKLGSQTGSFFNHLMSNNTATPDPEKGATELHWTDRTAWFVNSVSADGKSCVIEQAKSVRVDKLGMSDCQDYRYERHNCPEQYQRTLSFKWGSWKYKANVYGKVRWHTMKIAFGYMQEYYDYSF